MDIMEAILSRRSVREYTSEPVGEAEIDQLLRAAMNAPSAGKERPWHFVVIRSRATLEEIARFHPYAQMLHAAPAGVLVCADTTLERQPGFWVQDCAAAAQNIMLAAVAQGLGAVWVGMHPVADRVQSMRELLNLPEPVIPLALVAVGHPARETPRQDHYDTSRIHRERW